MSSDRTLSYHAKSVNAAEAIDDKPTEYTIQSDPKMKLRCMPSGKATFWYYYFATVNGVRSIRRAKLGTRGVTSLEDAVRKARDFERAVDSGEDPVGKEKAQADAMTFEELAEAYLQDGRMRDTTRYNGRKALELDAYPLIGTKPAETVDKADIIAVCRRIEKRIEKMNKDRGEHRDPGTQSERTKSFISSVLNHGIHLGLIDENVTKQVPRRVQKKPVRDRTPSSEELKTLWEALVSTEHRMSEPMRLIIKLSVLLGQRRGELAAMQYSELKLKDANATWTIPGDVRTRTGVRMGKTKNGKMQVLPLTPQVVELLKEAKEWRERGNDYVFPADIGAGRRGKDTTRRPHINPESVTRAMIRLRDAAGVEDISIHDMRRAISNHLKNEGFGVEVRDLILNHSSFKSVTEEHYTQSARMERQVREAMQVWSDYIGQLVGLEVGVVGNVVPMKRTG